MKVQTTKTARFSNVVAQAGSPEIYLPLFDPKQDRSFMRAVHEQRVLSIRQDPTSKHQDYGTVGFETEGHSTYLVFPKSLKEFAYARVVGIKYDTLKDVSAKTGTPPPSLKLPRSRARNEKPVASKSISEPEPPKPLEPQPKNFTVRMQLTTVTEKEVVVSAITKAEAKKKAMEEVTTQGKVRVVRVSEN